MSLKLQEDAYEAFFPCLKSSKKQTPTKLGHELERAELSVLVVGQDEHDVGS